MDISGYWKAVLEQDPDAMRAFFHRDAVINWHNTNEQFDTEEFLRANCEYPGKWRGELERIETIGDLIITVARVWAAEQALSFHVTSFIRTREDKIISIDEYWGDDGAAPGWRAEMHIGRPIR